MLKPISFILLGLALSNCDKTEMSAGTNKGKAEAGASSQGNSTPAGTQAHSETESMAQILEPEAVAPVVVSGAYLSCKMENLDVRCLAYNDKGEPTTFAARKAYIISGNPSVWTETSFTSANDQSWLVKANGASGSFAVALRDETSQVLADLILDENALPAMALLDGSFEDHRLDVANAPNYVSTNRQTNWKSLNARNSICEVSVIEYQSMGRTSALGPAKHGNQWIEMDSACQDGFSGGGGNTLVYQDLTLLPGHIYQLGYNFKARRGLTSLQQFETRFAGRLLANQVATDLNWVEKRFVLKADAAKARLEFEELGFDEGAGTLLDHVWLVDLGKGP